MPNTERYKILIVDDHAIVRRGLRQLLERESAFHVCAEAEDATQALAAADQHAPDLVVADLMLDGSSGLELTKRLHTYHPDLPVLIISMHDEQLYAERALRAGAKGYVMKGRSEAEIIRAAYTVLAGHVYVSKALQAKMQTQELPAGPEVAPAPLDNLTDRELEVFLLVGQGYAPRHIAEELHLSVSTIEVYRERLKEKLGLESSALLLRYAVRWCKDHPSA